MEDPPYPWYLRLKWPTPFQKPQLRPIFACSASTVTACKKVQLGLIGSRPRAFQRAIDEPCTLPLRPQRVAQNTILHFCSKIQLLSKNVCYKVSLCEISSGKVVATSFLYLTAHGWIAGDVPIYHILCSKWPTPSENADFDRFHLKLPQPWELAIKIQLALIGSRPFAFQWAIDKPCTLPLSPPKGGSKKRIFTFGVALHFFVAGNRRHLKLNMRVEHSKSLPTNDKTSLKWAWPRHLTHFKLLIPLRYLWNGLS